MDPGLLAGLNKEVFARLLSEHAFTEMNSLKIPLAEDIGEWSAIEKQKQLSLANDSPHM